MNFELRALKLSVIFPAYNEGDKIKKNLEHVAGWLREKKIESELIVVDDGSSDNTVSEAKAAAKEFKEISVIENDHRGKSFSVFTGVQVAKGEEILMIDVDLATPIEEYPRFSEGLKSHQIVIASREAKGAERVGEPWFRHFIGRIFNLFLVQLIALPGIQDSQCGFKLFKGNEAKEIFKRLIVYGPESEIQEKPFFGALDVEVLFIAKTLGYKVKELGVKWYYVPTTRLSFFNNAYKMARDVLKIRLNGLMGKYK